jgi:guanine deaminase
MTLYRARVLTPAPDSATLRFIDDALVEVDDDGRFVVVEAYDGRPVHEDLRPAVLLPGFVDAHLHFPQTRIVGSASGPLLEWLDRSTFPEEARFADGAHAQEVAAEFTTRLAAAGTTLSMVYSSVHPDACHALFEALEAAGLRAIAGPVLMDAHSPEELLLPVDEAMAALERLVAEWHGRDDRLQVAVIPRFALSCTMEMMQAGAALAKAHGLWVTTHLSENPVECQIACERFGTADYLSVYDHAGLLHDRSVYAHCIHLSDGEWDRFRAAGATVAHCPDSNAFLGSGGMPIGAVQARSIPLVMGSDIAAGRSFQIPRALSHAYDNALRQGQPLSLAQLLWMGTRGAALALHHPQVGAIEVGLEADMVLYEVPWWAADAEGVLASVFFDHDRPGPVATWVRGRQVHGE